MFRPSVTFCLSARHARKHFSGVEGDQMAEVQLVMGLLAFSPHTNILRYKVTTI